MRSEAVSPLLHRVLAAVLGTTALATAACGGTSGEPVSPLCEASQAYSVADKVRERAGLDFLARSSGGASFYGDQAGVACSGASNRAACQGALESARGDLNGLSRGKEYIYGYYVATRGDEVIVADAPAELAALVGSADDPNVAAFLALAELPTIECAKVHISARDDETLVTHTRPLGCIDGGTETRTYRVTRSGDVTLESHVRDEPERGCMVEGRLHEGQPRIAYDGDDAGSLLARAAFYEAGSVGSFVRLARELRVHGAPRELVSRAVGAARDEVRHARAMRRLAERRGATVVRPPRAPRAVRPLEDVARENAVEGCVRETHAALVALHQASCARDEAVREAMSGIARDEIGHASLAWAVAEWAEARLDPSARERIASSRAAAIEELRAVEAPDATPEARRALGLPEAAAARALATELAAALEARAFVS
ncbi:MAG: ferritin-like domain-containing protein [Labilithrix sp.]|nr:ferritin-like domain-containing protein [Labilithrix sp.]